MNNKSKKILSILVAFLFVILLCNIFIKVNEKNNSDITNMNILTYVPKDYEFTILSNSTNNNIKKFINENISEKKRDELNMIKDSIFSYLGFDFKERFKDIYDNELAIIFFENELNKKDILLIFKLKKNKDINHIFTIDEQISKSDQIIELKRSEKLHYFSHIFQTKDNYIIASSNKKLINSSIEAHNNDNLILSRNLIPDDINLKEIKFLSISKYNIPKNNSLSVTGNPNKLITIVNLEDHKIKLRSFSQNINKINTKNLNNRIDNIKDIIFTNKYSPYKQSINFLYNDINQKEFIEAISQELNEELILITNNNNWVLFFKNKLPNKISIEQFNFLKKYKKEDLYLKNINYSIYTNDRLKIKDDNIIYEKESPIFSLKDEMNLYISNDFDTLQNITEKISLSDQYLDNNSDIEPYNYIFNDILFIKYINNDQLIKYYKSLKNLQYFINTKLFSLEDININIKQAIPERYEKVYLEANLKIL